MRTTLLATVSICGMLAMVVGMLVLQGTGLGIVEALSLSILVGMAVDYV